MNLSLLTDPLLSEILSASAANGQRYGTVIGHEETPDEAAERILISRLQDENNSNRRKRERYGIDYNEWEREALPRAIPLPIKAPQSPASALLSSI